MAEDFLTVLRRANDENLTSVADLTAHELRDGYFCPTPPKGKIHDSIRTNRVTTADFAFSSAATKLGLFGRSFFSRIPLPDGFYFAFPVLCETLIAQNRMGMERSFLIYRAHVTAPICIVAEHDGRKMRVL
jgi:hypothetical protein